MRKLMIESQDPVLEIFDHRYNPEKLLQSFYKVYPGAIEADKDKAYYSQKSASY